MEKYRIVVYYGDRLLDEVEFFMRADQLDALKRLAPLCWLPPGLGGAIEKKSAEATEEPTPHVVPR